MQTNLPRASLRWLAAALLATTLAACGGSGGGAEPEPNPPAQPGGPMTPEPSNPNPTPTTPVPEPTTPNPTPTMPDPTTPSPTPTTPTTPTPEPPPPPSPPTVPPMTVNVSVAQAPFAGPTGTVTVSFSSALNTPTLNTASFSVLEDASGQRHPMALSRPDPAQAALAPLSRYRYATRYRVQLAGSITGAAGEPFAGTTTFFTTGDGTWGTPTSAIGSVVNSEAPSLAVAPNGNAVVAFQANAGTGIKDVRAVSYNATTGVWDGSSEFLSNRIHDVVGPVKVVMDGQGSAIAVWSQLNGTASNGTGTRTDVYSSRKRFDGVWNLVANALEFDDSGSIQGAPDVATDAAGNAIATWSQIIRTSAGVAEQRLLISRFDVATGVWSSPPTQLDISTGISQPARVAMNAAGNAIVVYRNNAELKAVRYSAATNNWLPPQTVLTSANVVSGFIKINGAGQAVFVYETQNAAGITEVWANHFNPATNSWGATPVQIDSRGGQAVSPQISIDPAGNATAVWRQNTGGANYAIYANYMPWSTKVWGTATDVTAGFDAPNNPQIADDTGGPLLVFEVDLGGVKQLTTTRLQQGRAPLGSQGVERDLADATQPQIAIDPQGRAIVAYRYLLVGNQRTRAAHMR